MIYYCRYYFYLVIEKQEFLFYLSFHYYFNIINFIQRMFSNRFIYFSTLYLYYNNILFIVLVNILFINIMIAYFIFISLINYRISFWIQFINVLVSPLVHHLPDSIGLFYEFHNRKKRLVIHYLLYLPWIYILIIEGKRIQDLKVFLVFAFWTV